MADRRGFLRGRIEERRAKLGRELERIALRFVDGGRHEGAVSLDAPRGSHPDYPQGKSGWANVGQKRAWTLVPRPTKSGLMKVRKATVPSFGSRSTKVPLLSW